MYGDYLSFTGERKDGQVPVTRATAAVGRGLRNLSRQTVKKKIVAREVLQNFTAEEFVYNTKNCSKVT